MQHEVQDVYRVESNLCQSTGGGVIATEHYAKGFYCDDQPFPSSVKGLKHRFVFEVVTAGKELPQALPLDQWITTIVHGEEGLQRYISGLLKESLGVDEATAAQTVEAILANLKSPLTIPGFNPAYN
jgi:hypothetical protein